MKATSFLVTKLLLFFISMVSDIWCLSPYELMTSSYTVEAVKRVETIRARRQAQFIRNRFVKLDSTHIELLCVCVCVCVCVWTVGIFLYGFTMFI